MAKVLISLKIFPSDVNIDLEIIKSKIKEALTNYEVYKFEEEPIAFGLVAVIAHILVPEEEEGATEIVEEAIRGIKEISEIQTIMVRRI